MHVNKLQCSIWHKSSGCWISRWDGEAFEGEGMYLTFPIFLTLILSNKSFNLVSYGAPWRSSLKMLSQRGLELKIIKYSQIVSVTFLITGYRSRYDSLTPGVKCIHQRSVKQSVQLCRLSRLALESIMWQTQFYS